MSERIINYKSVIHVISEPGDMTRYDYHVMNDGPDNFIFAPNGSTFRFPQRINYYEGVNALNDPEQLKEIAERENCNPCTVIECINMMVQIQDMRLKNGKK